MGNLKINKTYKLYKKMVCFFCCILLLSSIVSCAGDSEVSRVMHWDFEIGTYNNHDASVQKIKLKNGWQVEVESAVLNIAAIYLQSGQEQSTLAILESLNQFIMPQAYAHAGHGINQNLVRAEYIKMLTVDLLESKPQTFEHLFAYAGNVRTLEILFPKESPAFALKGIASKGAQKIPFSIELQFTESTGRHSYATALTEHDLQNGDRLLVSIALQNILKDINFETEDVAALSEGDAYILEEKDVNWLQISRRLRQKESYILSWH